MNNLSSSADLDNHLSVNSVLIISSVLLKSDSLFTCYDSIDNEYFSCARSHSLCLEISLGDLVLVAKTNTGNFIVSILRSSTEDILFNFNKDFHINSKSFKIKTTNFEISSFKITINAISAFLMLSRILFATKSLKFYAENLFGKIKLAVLKLNHRVIKNSGNDVLIANQIHIKADKLIRQKANLIQINADSYVLVDGKKILMG